MSYFNLGIKWEFKKKRVKEKCLELQEEAPKRSPSLRCFKAQIFAPKETQRSLEGPDPL